MGELAAGAAADLVLVEGDPLEDIGVLADSSNIKLIIKQGLLAKVGTRETQETELTRNLIRCIGVLSCVGQQASTLPMTYGVSVWV